MTASHIFYIPAILLAGLLLGYVLGRKAVLSELEQQRRRMELREARRAAARAGVDAPPLDVED